MATKLDMSKLDRGILKGYRLAPHLDKAIALAGDFPWTYEHESKKGDKAFHPSSHCLPSAYELYQMITEGEPEDISPGLRKTFAVGHFWHGYLYKIIVDHLGFCEWSDIECPGTRVWGMNGDGSPKPYHYSQGSADIARCNIPVHGEYLVDIKTMNSFDFRLPGLPERFAKKYEAQAQIYMDYFDIDRTLILKVNKDSPHDFAEVEILRSQPLIDAIYEKWFVTSACLIEHFPPDPSLKIELPF